MLSIDPRAILAALVELEGLADQIQQEYRTYDAVVGAAEQGDPRRYLHPGLTQSTEALAAGRRAESQLRTTVGRTRATIALITNTDAELLMGTDTPGACYAPLTSHAAPSDDSNRRTIDVPLVFGVILPPTSDAEMRALAEDIAATRNKLAQRYQEMRDDKAGLYPARPHSIPGIGSWLGHQQQYEGWRQRLKNLFNKWSKKGGFSKYPDALPEDAQDWADTKPPAKPAPFTLLPPEPRPAPVPVPTPAPPLVFPGTAPEPAPTSVPFPIPTPDPLLGPAPFPAPVPVPAPTPVPFPVYGLQKSPVMVIEPDSNAGINGDDVTRGAIVVGGSVVGGYLIYRGVRLLPSLFPPLWPTLPLNLAAP